MMLSKEKLSNRGRGKRALAYILLIAVCVIIIYPLLWTIGASFNPGNSLVSTSIIPKNPTNEHYVKLFAGEGNLFYKQWYLNSLKISVFTMLLSYLFLLQLMLFLDLDLKEEKMDLHYLCFYK